MTRKPSKKAPLVSFLKVEQGPIREIKRALEDAAKQIELEILKSSGDSFSDRVTRQQLMAQKAAIKSHLNSDFLKMQGTIADAQRQAAIAASEVVSDYEEMLTSKVFDNDVLAQLRRSEALRAASSLDTLVARVTSSKTKLSPRVYDTKKLADNSIDKLVNTALARGLNAREFAASVRSSINPNVPGGVSYAATRLARTEINNAYHAASTKRYQESEFTESVDWNLSSSHPGDDDCDALASDSPYDVENVPKKPHPNCFCFITPNLPTESQFLKNLFDGKYGEPEYDTPTNEALSNHPKRP